MLLAVEIFGVSRRVFQVHIEPLDVLEARKFSIEIRGGFVRCGAQLSEPAAAGPFVLGSDAR